MTTRHIAYRNRRHPHGRAQEVAIDVRQAGGGKKHSDQALAEIVALHSLKGNAVEFHSEQESFRGTLTGRTPANERATLIVTRKNQRVWVTFDGAIKTTFTMNDPETTQLVDLLQAAQALARDG